jgi:hypothetical protein
VGAAGGLVGLVTGEDTAPAVGESAAGRLAVGSGDDVGGAGAVSVGIGVSVATGVRLGVAVGVGV